MGTPWVWSSNVLRLPLMDFILEIFKLVLAFVSVGFAGRLDVTKPDKPKTKKQARRRTKLNVETQKYTL